MNTSGNRDGMEVRVAPACCAVSCMFPSKGKEGAAQLHCMLALRKFM
jgi:hypothetical protein